MGGPSSHHSYPPFSPLTSQQYLPEVTDAALSDDVVRVDLSQPMDHVLAKLRSCPVRTRLSLTGPLVVARDIAHAKLKERLDKGEGLPQYMRDMAVYYAGPAKTPEGYASGSFGPTTAGRMDSYVDAFQAAGGSMVMLAKGNRSGAVTRACQKHGGFYLGSIGGPAAILAQNNITKVEVLEYAELGMEAIWCVVATAPPGLHRRGLTSFGARIFFAGKSKLKTSPRSWWWTTRATTSSRSGALPGTD